VKALAIAAAPEEAAKLAVLLGIALRHIDARRLQDVMLASVGVAMGFAAIENLAYLAAVEAWPAVAVVRATVSVPAHGAYGLVMGASMIMATIRPDGRRSWMALAFAAPVAAHALFDFPLFLHDAVEGLGWPLPVWSAMVVALSFAAVLASDRALRPGAAADTARGLERSAPSALVPAALGVATMLAALGFALGCAIGLVPAGEKNWIAAMVGVLPMMLALDLIRTALRRRPVTAATDTMSWQGR
jgi:hypothetical protein